MRRREFIAGLGGAAVWPLAGGAQQSAMPVVGFLCSQSAWEFAYLVDAFRRGLEETGYIEGRNVLVEYRWAEGHYERLPMLAADLIRRPASVIAATGGGVAARVMRGMTGTIPIVFQTGFDPVAAGLVASLNRPGGNSTGVTGLGSDLVPKRLQYLKELLPSAKRFAVLMNPTNPAHEADTRSAQDAARELGIELHVLNAGTESEVTRVFESISQLGLGGLAINPDGFFLSRSELLAALTLRHNIPAIFQYRLFALAGGLMCYGSSDTEQFRLVGIYVGRILRGERPAELPVQQATRVELTINLKTAKALGIQIPETLLASATEVIE